MAAGIAGAAVFNGLLPPDEVILGRSVAMNEVREKLKKVACTDVPVLIRGEAGTGKEMLARLIHRRYPGETTPFHKVIPAGHEGWRKSVSLVVSRNQAGSDAHAHLGKPGTPACIGTLFFKEIAELNFVSQRKLAHLLHDDQTAGNRVSECSPSLLRMICSTRHDIEQEVGEGNFREDLFDSVNVVSLRLPPLRARREDIPGLVKHFWETCKDKLISSVPMPSSRLMEAFQLHIWPGNIRELADMMGRYMLRGSEDEIFNELAAVNHSRPALGVPVSRSTTLKGLAKQEAREIEQKIIVRTLREARWNRKWAARALNMSYRALLYKIKEAGLPPKREVMRREREN